MAASLRKRTVTAIRIGARACRLRQAVGKSDVGITTIWARGLGSPQVGASRRSLLWPDGVHSPESRIRDGVFSPERMLRGTGETLAGSSWRPVISSIKVNQG